jgi:hypothetical protein
MRIVGTPSRRECSQSQRNHCVFDAVRGAEVVPTTNKTVTPKLHDMVRAFFSMREAYDWRIVNR